MNRIRKLGVGTKIMGGCLALVVVALILGGVGYFSLGSVIFEASTEEVANRLQSQMLSARLSEKNFMITRDDKSYEDLIKALDEIDGTLKELGLRNVSPEDLQRIAEARQAYLESAARMKDLVKAEDATLVNLASVADKMAQASDAEAKNVAATVKESTAKTMKWILESLLKQRVKDVLSMAFFMLHHSHKQGKPPDEVLDMLRASMFGEGNFFIVVGPKGEILVHGQNKELEGKNVSEIKDPETGKPFLAELAEGARLGSESEAEAHWVDPTVGRAVPVTVLAKLFPDWDLVVLASVYSSNTLSRTNYVLNLVNEGLAQIAEAGQLDQLTLQARLAALYFLKYGKDADKVTANLKKLKELGLVNEKISGLADSYNTTFLAQVDNDKAMTQQQEQVTKVAGEVLEVTRKTSETSAAEFDRTAQRGRALMVIVVVVGCLGGIFLALMLTRSVTKPVRRAVEGLNSASDQMAGAANEVNAASERLAQGASQQAASLEETSASLEEMASMSRGNADNAGQANGLMDKTRQVVRRADESMTELKDAMETIKAASDQTSKIIKTIDEIAFQTNLLALNAAVEAARAGEAGAGFAVVADEVRNLAMRAAEAARNTASIIESNLHNIGRGSELVSTTDEAFAEVRSSSAQVAEILGEISAASAEQSQGVDELNRAVSDMDRVVQDNASAAEETAASSHEMQAQAASVQNFVADLAGLISGGKTLTGSGGKRRKAKKKSKLKKGAKLQAQLPPPAAPKAAQAKPSKKAKEPKEPMESMEAEAPKAAAAPAAPGRRPKPEEAIPFDDDVRDFEDF